MSNGITLLHRPRDGRWLAGVAAGLARRFGVPVWIVRAAFILICFVGGLGALLYLVGWLLIPAEGETDAIVQGWFSAGQARRWVGVILVGLAVIILASETGLIRGDLAFAAVLIGIGVMLYRGDLSRGDRHPGDLPPAGQHTPPDAVDEAPVTPRVSAPVQAPAPPRERSFLGRVSVGVAVMALGLLGLFDTVIPGFHPEFRHYLVLLVAVIGLGLVIGAWFGTSGGLVALGVVLVPILVLSSLAELGNFTSIESTSIGQVHHRPGSVEEIRDVYRLGIGELVIDFRDVDFAGRTVEVETQLGMGELLVRIPEGVSADVAGQVGMGMLQVGDREQGGIGVGGDYRLAGSEGKLVLDARVGMGQVVVNSWPVVYDRHIYRIQDAADLQDTFFLEKGSLRLDLADLVLQNDRSVSIDVGRGEVWVIAPRHLGLHVSARVDRGFLTLFDEGWNGSNLYAEDSIHLVGAPLLTLSVRLGDGNVIIEEGQ